MNKQITPSKIVKNLDAGSSNGNNVFLAEMHSKTRSPITVQTAILHRQPQTYVLSETVLVHPTSAETISRMFKFDLFRFDQASEFVCGLNKIPQLVAPPLLTSLSSTVISWSHLNEPIPSPRHIHVRSTTTSGLFTRAM